AGKLQVLTQPSGGTAVTDGSISSLCVTGCLICCISQGSTGAFGSGQRDGLLCHEDQAVGNDGVYDQEEQREHQREFNGRSTALYMQAVSTCMVAVTLP